jgi:hypothetical protein
MNKLIFFLIILPLLLTSCSKDKNDSVIKKKQYEPNLDKRLEKEKGKLQLFGSSKNMDVFGSQNVMWRASINVLKNIPLASISYDAGMIVTDWYSAGQNSNDSIKIVVNITSNEVKIDSINVSGFKKTCKQNLCSTSSTSENFNQQIKSRILEKTRELSIKDIKK